MSKASFAQATKEEFAYISGEPYPSSPWQPVGVCQKALDDIVAKRKAKEE